MTDLPEESAGQEAPASGASASNSYGLKEDWASVEETLGQIIPVYDRTNRYISLGTDLKVRKEGLSLFLKNIELANFSQPMFVLDLGSGPGKMTEMFANLHKLNQGVPAPMMFDALRQMMVRAKARNSESEGVLGVYENIPLKSGSVDAAMAGFAIRDARDLAKAIREVQRVLKEDGLWLIVDLTKPDSRLKRTLVGFYWRALAPLIAFIAAGRLGLKFGALSTTYQRLPTSSRFLALLESFGFYPIETRFAMMGGVCILVLRKQGVART